MAAASGALACLFRVGLKLTVTGTGAAVGLNGGFLHTAQLGANDLRRAEMPTAYAMRKHHASRREKGGQASGNRADPS